MRSLRCFLFGWMVVWFFPFFAFASSDNEERIAVIVGANTGGVHFPSLRYAEQDAMRMHALLLEMGHVKKERAILLLDSKIESLRKALREAKGRAAELQLQNKNPVFIFYYSGHGDNQNLDFSDGLFSYVELEQALFDIPAQIRVSVLDACRTNTSLKGIRKGPNFAISSLPESLTGTIVMRSSADGEASQESEELSGSIFTHYLLSALRGNADSNHDGEVSLAEVYHDVYQRTIRRTLTGPVLQHPALSMNLTGVGEWVMSYPKTASAQIRLPKTKGHYTISRI